MEQLHIEKEKMFNLMESIGFSEFLIKANRIVIDRYIEFLNDHFYEPNLESAKIFSKNYFTLYPQSRKKDYCETKARRAVYKFIRFIETGEINSRWIPKPVGLSGVHSKQFNLFIEDERNKVKYLTLRERIYVVSEFNEYLNSNNVSSITSEDIINYFLSFTKNNAHPHAFYHRSTIIKKLLKFLYINKFLSEDLSGDVPYAKYQRPKELPSSYTNEEISMILNSIDRNSKVGKRDYAMISLAVYLGLRAGDIVNLEFSNIDWENNLIKLTISKTSKETTLPLLPEVGNALLDYIKNSRRQCDLKHVFISASGACSKITSATLYNKVKSSIKKSKIDTKNRKLGPHALRHSLATRMLKQGQPLPIISETLGHSDTQVTTIYTSIDYDSLKHCALEVLPIKSSAYMSGGEYDS